MKFSVAKEPLQALLVDINAIVDRRNVQAIVGHVLMVLKGNLLFLQGTDTEISLAAQLEVTGQQDGEITVPAAKWLDIIRLMPKGALLECSLEDENFIVRAAESRFSLSSLPAVDFPVLNAEEPSQRLLIAASHFSRAMKKVEFSIAVQDVRYAFNGLYLRPKPNTRTLEVVSTDGHRLSCAQTELLEVVAPEARGVILPKKAVNELIKLSDKSDETLQLALNARQMRLAIGPYQFTTNLLDSEFPHYESVIPEPQSEPAVLNREQFIEALQRTQVVLKDDRLNDGITLHFKPGALHLFTRNQNNETADEKMNARYTREALRTSFNINYLLAAAKHLEGETLEMHFSSADSPCLMVSPQEPEIRYTIMPMRL